MQISLFVLLGNWAEGVPWHNSAMSHFCAMAHFARRYMFQVLYFLSNSFPVIVTLWHWLVLSCMSALKIAIIDIDLLLQILSTKNIIFGYNTTWETDHVVKVYNLRC